MLSKNLCAKPSQVALLTGLLAGAIALVPKRSFPFAELVLALLIGWVLLWGPAITKRSFDRFKAGLLCTVFLLFISAFFLLGPFIINGREELPLVVRIAPGTLWATPYYDDYSWGWQVRAMVSFVLFWIGVDFSVILIRNMDGFRRFPAVNWKTAIATVSIGVIPVLCLYPLSWSARVSGTFHEPLYSTQQYYTSLVIFFLIFPIKTWSTEFLCASWEAKTKERYLKWVP